MGVPTDFLFYYIYKRSDLFRNNPTVVEQIDGIILAISNVLYQPWFVPVFLIVGGIIFTFATKFIQVRLFPEAIKVIKEKPKSENGISSFGALMVSTASRVGTGNSYLLRRSRRYFLDVDYSILWRSFSFC